MMHMRKRFLITLIGGIVLVAAVALIAGAADLDRNTSDMIALVTTLVWVMANMIPAMHADEKQRRNADNHSNPAGV